MTDGQDRCSAKTEGYGGGMGNFVMWADGSCAPNPGTGAYGLVVREDGALLFQTSRRLPGTHTNNTAEWHGAIAALEFAAERDYCASVELRMDSNLVVNQLAGRWKVKNHGLLPLVQKGRSLLDSLRARGVTVTVRWVPREENAEADALSGER